MATNVVSNAVTEKEQNEETTPPVKRAAPRRRSKRAWTKTIPPANNAREPVGVAQSQGTRPPQKSSTSARRAGGRSSAPPKLPPARPLPKDVVAEMDGMSPEDAAAYRKVQLGTAAPARQNTTRAPAKRVAKKTVVKKERAKAPRQTQKTAPRPTNARRSENNPPAQRRETATLEVAPPKTDKPAQRTNEPPVAKAAKLPEKDETSTPLPAAPKRRRPPRRRRDSAEPRQARTEEQENDKPKLEPKPEKPKAAPATSQPRIGNGCEMIVNEATGDECRIAVLFERKLEEFFIERSSSLSHVGNIYKGIITNVESSIQAAFIDFGLPKHGFLHISDVQPQYFSDRAAELEGVGQKVPRRDRPPIQKCFKKGQEVIVQVIKEGVGTKGPTLSTYLSIPGSYLVMMPGMTRLGVSRKIEDDEARRAMRDVLSELDLPNDMGFILRTAGEGRTKRDLQRDLNYLQRLWKTVAQRVRSTKAPATLYRESDLITRTIRDVFTSDFDRIIVDSEDTAKRAREFLRIAMPRASQDIIQVYESHVPIFHHYGVEEQIEAIHSRHVKLSSGGSIVIDQTEALVAIDVNSGRLRTAEGEEETAYQTNIHAAREIARQLRLRDLGGLVVCDFIDMRYDRHKRAVERELRDQLKKHKERARILRMSQFGLIELTRQRQGPSIKGGIYADCPHCAGSGLVKTPESMTLHVLRNIQKAIYHENVVKLTVTVAPDVAFELQNRKRAVLHELETGTGKAISIRSDPSATWDRQDYSAQDSHGRVTRLFTEFD